MSMHEYINKIAGYTVAKLYSYQWLHSANMKEGILSFKVVPSYSNYSNIHRSGYRMRGNFRGMQISRISQSPTDTVKI